MNAVPDLVIWILLQTRPAGARPHCAAQMAVPSQGIRGRTASRAVDRPIGIECRHTASHALVLRQLG